MRDRERERVGERGSSLLLVLVLLLVTSFLGIALLLATDVDLETSKATEDASLALRDAGSGVQEVAWRLNLKPAATPPPAGSRVTVNDLVAYDARIDPDPAGLLKNLLDDDADGRIDEPDELNFGRDWKARIVLSRVAPAPGSPWEIADADPVSGPPWGSHVVLATIQPEGGWRAYTTESPADFDVLTVRFRLDTDTVPGDAEGDGPEIVFHDESLYENSSEDRNTLTALGGNANPADDSPYNVTWSDGTTTFEASGSPVLVVRSSGRLVRAGRAVTTRRVEVELKRRRMALATRALCGCTSLTVPGGGSTDSYRSSEGEYGSGPVYQNGNVGSNGDVALAGEARIAGNVEAFGAITFSGLGATVERDAVAGGAVVGPNRTILGLERPFTVPRPRPCVCDGCLAEKLVNDARTNEDGAILPDGTHAYRHPTSVVLNGSIFQSQRNLRLQADETIILTGGSYYFDSIALSGSSLIQVGLDTDGNGLVDAPPGREVHVFVAGDVYLGGQGVVNLGRPTDFQVFSSAIPPDDVTVAGGTEFRGLIYAPTTDVTLAGANDFKGAALGREVKNTGGAAVHFDEDLLSAAARPGAWLPVSWREIE